MWSSSLKFPLMIKGRKKKQKKGKVSAFGGESRVLNPQVYTFWLVIGMDMGMSPGPVSGENLPADCSFPPPLPSGNGATAAGIIVSLVVLVVIVLISVACARRARRAIVSELRAVVAPPPTLNMVQVWEMGVPTMERFLQDLAKERPVRFTAQQLCSFTTNYATRLGLGGFGVVYKGQFPNGVKIAVKVLNRSLDKGAEEQFMAEVSTIGRTYHINLVRLYGFCYDHIMSVLVYEYMENGSLDKHLFSDTQAIEWVKLHEIAIGTAKGITYLHEECQQRIIHYDIKPGNVLLDANFSPKSLISDWQSFAIETTHMCLPQDIEGLPVTQHRFGMLLFEIVGRRRNTKVGADESMDWFPKHVWDEFEKGELGAMTLSCGIEDDNREKAERMAMVALWCVQDSPQERPPMSVVVKMLEGEVEVKAPPKPFHYLYSLANVLNLPNSSDYTSSEGSNTHWYKDTTPIMAKYEIQMASSS
ncbi:unnamed protein product [Camellia sinensis]